MNITKEVKLANTNRQVCHNYGLVEKNLVSRGHTLPADLCLDPDRLSLQCLCERPNYIVGSGTDTAVIIGGILEIIVALAGIGTAVALFPVLKRQNKELRWASSGLGFWKPARSSPMLSACWRS